MQKINKAVIAAAGFGTRFLPQTKAMPKEMLPIVDKPIIQYVVEELVSCGIEDIIIVTNQNKRSIEDHFDKPNSDLLANLKAGGRKNIQILHDLEVISNLANFIYIRQKGAYGNATPLLNAEHLLGNEPFIYTWSDDFILAKPLRFKQMMDVYNQYQRPVLSLIETTEVSAYDKYGFVKATNLTNNIYQIMDLIEKPGQDKSPSNLATVSGYILTPDIFQYLHTLKDNLNDKSELYCTDAIKLMIQDDKTVLASLLKNAKYFDAGNKTDFIKANIWFALQNESLRQELIPYLKTLINNH